ncbi:hypothetical protein CR970_01115 [Candidatus Saccharibacteria bacterium]|nr:MAG: hypothetical protein CR970_01115 [Candidatus Saccharibacteria bacterium]
MTHLIEATTRLLSIVDQSKYDVPKVALNETSFSTVLQMVFGVAGAIAFLMLTIAGFRYVNSRNRPQEVAKAKDTIIYAFVGLIICMTAFSIVRFVMARV